MYGNGLRTHLSPSAGTTSLILSFWLISSIRRWVTYASNCSAVMGAVIAVGRFIRPAALLSDASPQRLRLRRFLVPSGFNSGSFDTGSGLRPRLPSFGGGAKSGLPFASPPRRRVPRGMLLEPVLPALLRHDMMMLRDGVAMGCGRQESRLSRVACEVGKLVCAHAKRTARRGAAPIDGT
jgi:hypothetical protein